MCATCGCSNDTHAPNHGQEHSHVHGHEHSHVHGHGHGHGHAHTHVHEHGHEPAHRASPRLGPALVPGRPVGIIRLEQEILGKNRRVADANRQWLSGRRILALNLLSSPGAGKTSLLERTLRELGHELGMSIIEGDQETERDAERIRATGSRAVQINTGTGCHLDADMVRRGLAQLEPAAGSVVVIENVGNLVCPALFDLGEHKKVLIFAVTEGEDKPLKYPHMFRACDLLILNKIDLLPYVPFDLERCLGFVAAVNPRLQVLPVSVTRGDGLGDWFSWLREQARRVVAPAVDPAAPVEDSGLP